MADNNETDLPFELPAEVVADLMGLIGAIDETSSESQAATSAELIAEPRAARAPAPKPIRPEAAAPAIKPKSRRAPVQPEVNSARTGSASPSVFSDMAVGGTVQSPRAARPAAKKQRVDVELAAQPGVTKVDAAEADPVKVVPVPPEPIVDIDLVDPVELFIDADPIVDIDLRDGAEPPAAAAAAAVAVEFDLNKSPEGVILPLPEPVPDDFPAGWFRYNWPFVLAALFVAVGLVLIFLVLTGGSPESSLGLLNLSTCLGLRSPQSGAHRG